MSIVDIFYATRAIWAIPEEYQLFENYTRLSMQQKLSFLLDRNRPFDFQSAQILDDLSLSLKNNAQNVPTFII